MKPQRPKLTKEILTETNPEASHILILNYIIKHTNQNYDIGKNTDT